MPQFNKRSYDKELLDEPGISFDEIRKNMQELDVINRLLGGHRITLNGIKKIHRTTLQPQVLRILELGCGGGNNLRVIKQWAEKHNIQTELSGVDVNPECIHFAKSQQGNSGINFICSDYKKVTFNEKQHIIFSVLFCHHFTNEEIIFMLNWMKQRAATGFFINDLHRHPLAYYSIKALTSALSNSKLVKNDAPLSVLRGFRECDWKNIFKAAGIPNYTIEWQWAFRWLLTATK